MFEKNMRIAYLCDFYIDLFDPHSQGILKAYYEDDLSLAEIALDEGISRQGIRHVIKKCEDQMLFYEDKLGLAKRYEELEKVSERLASLKASLPSDKSAEIDDIVAIILNKGV